MGLKKLTWDEVVAEQHYYLCCPDNQHFDIVYAVQRPGRPCVELLFHGDQFGQLVTEYRDAEFYTHEMPEGLENYRS